MVVVVLAVVTGCDGATSDEAVFPEWASSLFADVEDLTTIESEEASVVFEFRGNATGMADLITDRLDRGDDFILHEQLMVTGETDDGQVQVVWTPSNPGEFSGLGDGIWTVVATLTDP
ncbi:MAG TPA: hypothetical protein VMQ46_05730 [Acidimicrobiia bacterium]|nr:hypothetical protein [Acidimicrobiia bacterium]